MRKVESQIQKRVKEKEVSNWPLTYPSSRQETRVFKKEILEAWNCLVCLGNLKSFSKWWGQRKGKGRPRLWKVWYTRIGHWHLSCRWGKSRKDFSMEKAMISFTDQSLLWWWSKWIEGNQETGQLGDYWHMHMRDLLELRKWQRIWIGEGTDKWAKSTRLEDCWGSCGWRGCEWCTALG